MTNYECIYDKNWDGDGEGSTLILGDLTIHDTVTVINKDPNTEVTVEVSGHAPKIIFRNFGGGIKCKVSGLTNAVKISEWDVSGITNMSYMFYNCTTFSQPLSSWNVSNVRDMSHMFSGCTIFNQPLSSWNVSKVTNMSHMFFGCRLFDQPFGKWNVSKVTNMSNMFYYCTNFNQSLNDWDVSNVTNMLGMFAHCENFYQDLNGWNVSDATDMTDMFYGCDRSRRMMRYPTKRSPTFHDLMNSLIAK